MKCPNCGKENANSASYCIFCGAPLAEKTVPNEGAPRLKGSLSGKTTIKMTERKTSYRDMDSTDSGNSYSTFKNREEQRGSLGDDKESTRGSSSFGLKSTIGKTMSRGETKTEGKTYTYCKKCGRKLQVGEKCPDCILRRNTSIRDKEDGGSKKSKTGLIATSVVAMLILVIGIASAMSKQSANTSSQSSFTNNEPASNDSINNDNYSQGTTLNRDPLSASCDYILCAGTDYNGNKYELVANQTESSQGFEIAVGVIKNNSWLYQLSSDFPFLGEDGLFHVSVPVSFVGDDAGTGTSLLHPNRVVDKLYFIDSGAFLMECYRESKEVFGSSETYYLLFSCDTLSCKRLDPSKTILIYRYIEPQFASGNVESYGRIFTDNGKIIQYEETSGTISGWTEDQVFRWDILDAKTLTTTTIASNVKGIRPRSALAEGMFFCSDKRFYNTNAQPVVDLTDYDIDVWDSRDIFFDGGTCTFEVKNSLGTRFRITIDTTGSLLREQPV